MRPLSEIRAFEETFEIFSLPAMRIIGCETRSGGNLGNQAPPLWDRVYASGNAGILMKLPRIAGDALYGWTCEHDPVDDTHCYLVCALTPAGTPVPEGFVYRDYPATLCARGRYGEKFNPTMEHIKAAGFAPNWEVCPWNAELYLQAEEDDPPVKGCAQPFHWLIPVRKV